MYAQTSHLKVLEDAGKFLIDDVAFFGRTLAEYEEMFHFEREDLRGKRILDCASGPASFAAEAHIIGVNVTACDPMYEKRPEDLYHWAAHDVALCLKNKDNKIDLFDPHLSEFADQFEAEKIRAMRNFRNDFARGRMEGRYVPGILPDLPFSDDYFHMALCSNLLFLYASEKFGGILSEERFNFQFHMRAVFELLRVVKDEVRIYPIKGPNRPDSPMADAVVEALRETGIRAEYVSVDFKDVAGANQMLRIIK